MTPLLRRLDSCSFAPTPSAPAPPAGLYNPPPSPHFPHPRSAGRGCIVPRAPPPGLSPPLHCAVSPRPRLTLAWCTVLHSAVCPLMAPIPPCFVPGQCMALYSATCLRCTVPAPLSVLLPRSLCHLPASSVSASVPAFIQRLVPPSLLQLTDF